MNGIEFLTQVKARSPITVRMMLTGNTDLETAVQAVNEGQVFRFINKPCESDLLIKLIEGGLEYHRLIIAEKELLTQTLSGSVKLLTDLLALLDNGLFQDALLIRDMAKTVVEKLQMKNAWEVMLAAMLSRLGYLSLSKEVLEKLRHGQELTPQEKDLVDQGAEVGFNLLRQIPRLGGVAQIVRYQHKGFDGSGYPADEVAGNAIPLGARILKILIDYIELSRKGKPKMRCV